MKAASPTEEQKNRLLNYSADENIAYWKFLHSRTHDQDNGLLEKFPCQPTGKSLWEEYIRETGSQRTIQSLQKHFHRSMTKLHEIPLDVEAKLDLYYSLSIPVHKQFMPTARKFAHLFVDKLGNIEAFEMKKADIIEQEEKKDQVKNRKSAPMRKRSSTDIAMEPAKRLVETPRVKRSRFTIDEDLKMCDFVLKCIDVARKNEMFKPTSKQIWKEFIETEGGQRSPTVYAARFRKLVIREVHPDLRAKISEILNRLNIPLEPELLEQLNTQLQCKTDANMAIVEYNSKNRKTRRSMC
uniref:SPK domain-containing protein n=1 Tax=Caenorhabditis japonica TaxID=281687 RepID=A0A8R1DT09_CAEJA